MNDSNDKKLESLLETADSKLTQSSFSFTSRSIRDAANQRKTNRRIRRTIYVMAGLLIVAGGFVFNGTFSPDITPVVKHTDPVSEKETVTNVKQLLADSRQLAKQREEFELHMELSMMERKLADLKRQQATQAKFDPYETVVETNTAAYSMLLAVTPSLDSPLPETARPKLQKLIDYFPDTSAAEVATRLLAQN